MCMSKERRKFPRFDLEYTIQILSQDGEMVMTALTSNLSDGGLRLPIPTECLPEKGEELQLNLTVRRNTTGEVEMYTGLGEVIRHTAADENGESEVALKFDKPMNLHLIDEAQPSLS